MAKQTNDRDNALKIPGKFDWLVIDEAACTAQAEAQDRSDNGKYYLEPEDQWVQVVVPASGSIGAVLPRNGRESRGKTYNFVCVKDDGGTGFTVEDQDDALVSGKNYTTASNGLTAVGNELELRGRGVWYSEIKAVLT